MRLGYIIVFLFYLFVAGAKLDVPLVYGAKDFLSTLPLRNAPPQEFGERKAIWADFARLHYAQCHSRHCCRVFGPSLDAC